MSGLTRAAAGEMRRRVFKLLTEGKSQAEVARILKRQRSTVSEHASTLVSIGALKVASGRSTPRLYVRGPKAGLLERGLSVRKTDRVGWSAAPPDPERAMRVHRGTYVVETANLAAVWDRIPWAVGRSGRPGWEASGVRFGRVQYVVGGRPFTFAASLGRTRQSVKVESPEDFVADPSAVEQVELARVKAAAAAVGKWARDHGLVLQGGLKRISPIEFGIETPSLPKFGDAAGDPVWVDGSPGGEKRELETRMPAVAAAVLRLPEWSGGVDERLAQLEVGGAEVTVRMERLIGILQRHDQALKLTTEAVVRQAAPYSPEVA